MNNIRNTSTIVIILLNVCFIFFEVISYWNVIRIEFKFENILYFIIFDILMIKILLIFFIILKITDIKYLNILSNILIYIFILILCYLLSLNIKGLGEAIYGFIGDKDLIFENIFIKIYKIHSQEFLLDITALFYQECSVMKYKLSDEIKMQILGDAKTIGEVKTNVEIYCQIEFDNKIALEKKIELEKEIAHRKQLELEKNPLYRLKMAFNRNPEVFFLSALLGIGCIITFFYGGSNVQDTLTVIRDTNAIKANLKELASIASELISTEIAIKEFTGHIDHNAIIAHLKSILEKLNDLNNKL